MNYYNDNDPFCVEWLENLVRAGLIPPGDVDGRSIEDVQPGDLAGYDQVHLFAGIGGWSQALGIAGWPSDRPVWTASCPCPPFSPAGKKKGCPDCEARDLVWNVGRTGHAVCVSCGHSWLADARHLWPEAWRLISECGPARVYGEQVDGTSGLEWITGVQASLEILSYASWFEVLPAACVGAPHPRHRLWWVADATDADGGSGACGEYGATAGNSGGVGDPDGSGRVAGGASTETARRGDSVEPAGGGMGDAEGDDERGAREPGEINGRSGAARGSGGGLGDATSAGRERRIVKEGSEGEGSRTRPASAWEGAVLIQCSDGKWRAAPDPESGVRPLAHGVPRRVGRLRAYGNTIMPDVAALFITASEH